MKTPLLAMKTTLMTNRKSSRFAGGNRKSPALAWLGALCALLLALASAAAQDTNAAAAATNATAVAAKAPAPTVVVEAPDSGAAAAAGAGSGESAAGGAKPPLDRQAMVVFGEDVVLRSNETADVIVALGGSAKVHGKVRDAVVVIGGDIEVDGVVGAPVVAVIGDVKIRPGAELRQDAVAVLGDLGVESKAMVHGDAVAVGGRLTIADGSTIRGHAQQVALNLKWLRQWLVQCALKLRPLAPRAGWIAWTLAGVFFLFYALVAALFPRPVRACVNALEERPATTLLMGLLTCLVVPLVFGILVLTGVGILVLPFLGLALTVATIVGKVAMLEWIGLGTGRQSGVAALQRPLFAFAAGAIILTLFYMVWVVGLIVYGLVAVWGTGAAVTAALGAARRARAEKAALRSALLARTLPPSATPGPSTTASTTQPAGVSSAALAPDGSPGEPAPAQARPGPAIIAVPDALSYPRAGFWERMGAAFLDLVLIGMVSAAARGLPWSGLIALAYFAGLWTWKGTTVGGIVLGLKVVRLDGRPISFIVALVRALAAAFAAVVLFLGFFWIAWDPEKQGWHDLIAGTVVVRLPRSTPLVCA